MNIHNLFKTPISIIPHTKFRLEEVQKEILNKIQKYHNIKYTNAAIKAAVELSIRYINDKKLPDKAIDVIDELGASQRLLPEYKRKKV